MQPSPNGSYAPRRRDAADTALVERVRADLEASGDPGRAPGMQTYMKSELPYRGVAAPALKALLRTALAEHPLPDEETWQDTILELWEGAGFREERYAALALARHRRYREHQQVHTLELYRHLVETGAWWDLVDEIATHLVRDLLLAHPTAVAPMVREWAAADSMWVRRSAVICQVGSRDRCDQELLSDAITENLDGSTRTTPPVSPYGREFFVRKAIGWALRDHARTDPDWVREFVGRHAALLAGLSRREALRNLEPSGG